MLSSSAPPGPDLSAIQRVASTALQSRAVEVERLDAYLYRTYRLRNSQGFFYLFRCKPSHSVRLLRHEEERLEVEACSLQTLSGRSGVVSSRLIDCATSQLIGSPHLISGPFSGAIFSDIEPSLPAASLAAIDKSLGQYVRRLSALSGPSFGPLLQTSHSPANSSWTRQFASILETVLRDGEDALISLPYDGIRNLVRKHAGSLDQITTPRLLLLELGADTNIVVDPRTHHVTGVLDLSTALWGDPFLSDVFYKPTASFAHGFGRLPNADADERLRQYLYVLYHALLIVVRHVYRPRSEGDEMEARRDLTTAIRQLNAAAATSSGR